jgi:hypothetical protein
MTFDLALHRNAMGEHCLRLIHEGGPGWDAYVRDKAKRLAKDDPTLHGGLPAEVEQAISARSASLQPAGDH